LHLQARVGKAGWFLRDARDATPLAYTVDSLVVDDVDNSLVLLVLDVPLNPVAVLNRPGKEVIVDSDRMACGSPHRGAVAGKKGCVWR